MKRWLAGVSIAYSTAFAAASACAAPNLNEVEALVVRSTNAFRNEQGRGKLLIDPALTQAVRRQEPVVVSYPNSPSARALTALAERLLSHSPDGSPLGGYPAWEGECA